MLPVGRIVVTFPLEGIEKAAEAMTAGTTITPVLVPS
jgi:aryl-alcohol dehydrogenase